MKKIVNNKTKTIVLFANSTKDDDYKLYSNTIKFLQQEKFHAFLSKSRYKSNLVAFDGDDSNYIEFQGNFEGKRIKNFLENWYTGRSNNLTKVIKHVLFY